MKAQYEVSMRGWKKAYSKGDMKDEAFTESMGHGWRKRAKLLAEEVIIERKKAFIADKISTKLWRYTTFPDAYVAIFTNIFKSLEQ